MADLYSKASIILTANAYSSSKIYAIKPTGSSGDQAFTRASSGSRVNSSGLIEFVNNNIPRLTYSGSSCPQFLFEPQRINSLVQSNGFGTTWTLNAATVTASQGTSPDGTNNAWKLNEDTSNGTHDVRQASAVNVTAGTRYTISVFVKPAERNQVALQTNIGSAYDFTRFNLTGTGSVYPASIQPGHTASISQVGNGWFRIIDTVPAGTSEPKYFSINLQSSSINTTPNDSYTGTSATAGVYIYGAQIEAGRYPTSYIPTTTAAVTRIADASGGTGFVGTNMSSSIGQSEGTIYYEFTPAQTMVGFDGRILTALVPNTNQISGSVGIALNGNDQFQFFTYSASSAVLFNAVITSFPSPVTASRSYKIALAYSSSNSKAYINGSQVYSSAATWPLNGITGSQGPMNRIWLSNVDYFSPDNGNLCKTLAIYKTRLTDSELIALTS